MPKTEVASTNRELGMTSQQDRQFAKNTHALSDVIARSNAPEILIHLHIPKTGGTSLGSMVRHGFRNDEAIEIMVFGDVRTETRDGLGLARHEYCKQQLALHARAHSRPLRFVSGHLPFGVHRMFDRPAKYFTVIRHPIDRVISDFFFRIQENEPLLKEGRPLAFEEYVASCSDVRLRDYQVRVLSGCPELDAETVPVERHHLENAKRNIDEYFLAAAPLENMTKLALLMRRIYGWPIRRLMTEYKNPTKRRPRIDDISSRAFEIIAACNCYDLELYEWVGKKFASQCELFEPELSRDHHAFSILNHALNGVGQILPWRARKRLAEILFYA